MTQKKILITHLDALFPKVMASQDHVFKVIKRLARDHIVDVATTVRDDVELMESKKHLEGVCHAFHPIRPINPSSSHIKRKLYRLQYYIYHYLFQYPHHYFYAGHNSVKAQLLELAARNNYDIVQAEYWYMGQFFPGLKPGTFKVIETHDVCFDKLRQEVDRTYAGNPPTLKRKLVDKYRELELNCLNYADRFISISSDDELMFERLGFENKSFLMPIGLDTDYFDDPVQSSKQDVVLFYGSMGGEHNISAFFRFWNQIYPGIKAQHPNAKLLVVGANPPHSISSLGDGDNVVVTGFVEDVREQIAKAKVAVIPLDVAAGFRGRTLEIMAMGIPVIGTHKALDSVRIEDGRQGFISDSDDEMAALTVKLLQDETSRRNLGAAARQFVIDHYSVEATYGKLSNFYSALQLPKH